MVEILVVTTSWSSYLSEEIACISRVALSPGVPTMYDFFRHEQNIDHVVISALYKCFVFAPFLRKAADSLMAQYNLPPGKFTAIHMRLEDDFIRSIYNTQDVDSNRLTLQNFHYVIERLPTPPPATCACRQPDLRSYWFNTTT